MVRSLNRVERVEQRIVLLRGRKVVLDSDLAALGPLTELRALGLRSALG